MAEEKKRKSTSSVSRGGGGGGGGQSEKKKRKQHVVSKNPSNDERKKFNQKKKKSSNNNNNNNNKRKRNDGGGGGGGGKKSGPRLPSSLRKELGLVNHNPGDSDEDEINSDEGELHLNDVYEYDERMPEEDSKKNKRFDPVENLEYELPDEFEDENVPSDDDDDDDDNVEKNNKGKRDHSDQSGDEINEEDEERHARMLQGITGMPPEAFEGKKLKKNVVVSEAYPESEYNPSGDTMDGDGQINIQELLEPLQGTPSYSKIRKKMQQLYRNSNSVHAPLRKVDQEKLDREVAYKHSKKDLSKWQPLITKNREAPTIFFDEDTELGFSTVGAIASGFEPRTELEKKIASLNHDPSVVEAHKMDGAKLLELNKVSVEDVKDHQNRLAKMRSLLFRHELKAKHIKNIKSKTYHRLMKKDRLKKSSADMQMNPEAAKEQARKQEFKRAEERMTLKHKNMSKWATRILKRGLDAQDEGTRTAISEQLHQHALLTRKMNSMKDNSSSESSDGSSDEDDDDDLPAVTDQDGASKLVAKAKEKTIKAMEEDGDIPKSGLLSLPFMVRGLKKRQEAFEEDAKLVLQELDSLDQPEGTNGALSPKVTTLSGRRSFGVARKQSDGNNKIKSKSISRDRDSDSEDDLDTEDVDAGCDRNTVSHKDVHIDPSILNEESDMGHDSLFKSFEDIVGDPGPKTTYEVSMFASNTWKKMKDENKVESSNKKTSKVVKQVLPSKDVKEVDEDSDTESGEEMVDGILSSVAKSEFKLPSQAELIHLAFTGDDVEEEFEKEKLDILNEENPEPEKPVLVPGWGQWTHIQKKKGLPSWMLEEHANAKKKREDSLKMRRDSHLKHVFISERVDKKAEKLQTKKLPFPYTSEEVFEQSMRMPIGPEFNPATSVGALIRPEVVKTPGIIIKPIEYEDVNPYEKTEDHKGRGHSQKKSSGKKNKKNKGSNAKAGKKVMKSQGKQKAN